MKRSLLWASLTALLLAGILLWLRQQTSVSRVSAANSVGCPPGPLDCGPWPTQGHDNQRSNQSRYLLGPASPTNIKIVYDAGSLVLGDASITSDGKILLATCSPVVHVVDASANVDGSGYSNSPYNFPFTLSSNPYAESAVGFTVSSDGHIYVPIHECPDVSGAEPVNYYSLTKNGRNTANWPLTGVSAMYFPPALAMNGTIYQMDELNVVHAYLPDGTLLWNTSLPGFSQGAISLDSTGSLYIGTDGNLFGGHAVYSLDSSTGAIRSGWPQDTGGFTAQTTPAISADDVIYIATPTGSLFAFNADGSPRTGFPYAAGRCR